MTTASLIPSSGWGALVGGLLFPLAALVHPNNESLSAVMTTQWIPAHLLGWASLVLMEIGLIGLYARHHQRAGWLGAVSFLLALVGGGFAATIQYVASTAIPLIAAQAPSLFERPTTPPPFAAPLIVLGFVLGYVLFGVATFRAGVSPADQDWP